MLLTDRSIDHPGGPPRLCPVCGDAPAAIFG